MAVRGVRGSPVRVRRGMTQWLRILDILILKYKNSTYHNS